MDAVRQSLQQFQSVYRSLSASQRGTLAVVAAVVVGAFGYLMLRGSSSSYVPLAMGQPFTADELAGAEQTLIEAGLTDYHRDGARLMVPKGEVERYNAELLQGGTLPPGWGTELEKQYDKGSSIFESARSQQERRDVALAKELQRMIEAVPSIDRASVTWARSRAGRWPHNEPRVTANISVWPRRGHQLTPQLAESLRAAVATMVPDLETANVNVFDQRNAVSYTPEPEGSPFDSTLTNRIREFTQDYQGRIARALAYIPDVIVAVNVDVDDVRSRVERVQKLDTKDAFTSYSASRTRDEQSRQERPAGEPGVQSNRGRSLSLNAGPQQSHAVTEEDSASASLPSFTITDQAFFAAMPKAVQVSVQIPRDYYEAVAEAQGVPRGEADTDRQKFEAAVAQIERQELAKARATAAVLIPAGSPETAVNVSSYVPIERGAPEPAVPLAERAGDLLSRWGGTLALALFALWALWMLRKNFPKLPENEPQLDPKLLAPQGDQEAEEESLPPKPTKREHLQEIVRDNPEVAASIIGRWVEAAK
jgi:flagellar M-ring protein FliF